MRAILATMIFCFFYLFALPAEASHRHRHGCQYAHQHSYGRYLALRHYRHMHRRFAHRLKHFDRPKNHVASRTRETLPGPCHTAAAMGGPCGCWAAWTLLGRLDQVWHGINLWAANDWLRFPHVAAAPGTAVVWPNRHVAPVLRVHNDRTGRPIEVTTRESWGQRRVRLTGLVVVDPHPPIRAGWRAAEAWPL